MPHTPDTYAGEACPRSVRCAASTQDGSRNGSPPLLHQSTASLLRASFFALQRKAAPGVDGVTWTNCVRLGGSLTDLQGGAAGCVPGATLTESLHRRPTGGSARWGVAALGRQDCQQAVVTILNQIYEGDFKDSPTGSAGSESSPSADALSVGITTRRVNWVLRCGPSWLFR